MSFPISLYDALVSIAVPADKARAVADAMERDMGATLATKSLLLRQELGQLEQKVTLELNLVRKEMELALAHQALHTLARDPLAVGEPQLGVDRGRSVHAAVLSVDLTDPLSQPLVLLRPCR